MNKRHGNLRAAATVVVMAALGFLAPAVSEPTQAKNDTPGVGTSPVARGMLIPARMRMMVRFNPSRTA
ncbi:MAG: hypothetical protein ACKVZJ_05745 [Phycisphaerales bacterium]